jgi:hypothetical protein
MKKLIFVLAALLMATPAMAAVDITCAQVGDTNVVEISFNNSEPNKVRAIALDISTDVNFAAIECVHADYYIFPGTIDIDAQGQVDDYGTCEAVPSQHPDTLGGLDTNGITVEMGSLYEAGVDPDPVQSGVIVRLTLDANCEDHEISIAENVIRAGIVMENPDEVPPLNITGCTVSLPPCVTECFPSTAEYTAQYTDWKALGEPDCWCGIYLNPADWQYQCDGDTGNDEQVIGWRVYTNDLTILSDNWKKVGTDPTLNACADVDHKSQVIGWRCYTDDLTIMANNWKKTAAQLAGDCPRPD